MPTHANTLSSILGRIDPRYMVEMKAS